MLPLKVQSSSDTVHSIIYHFPHRFRCFRHVSSFSSFTVAAASVSISISIYHYRHHPNQQSYMENSRNPCRYT
jgi:hypothetical protein